MLNLVLIRHAHAGPHTEPDFERNLSERGKSEAIQSAQVIKYSNHEKGLWIASSANRTAQTADLIMGTNSTLVGSFRKEIFLYSATGREYINLIEQQTDRNIFLIGHNPSISFVASYLSNQMIEMGTADVVHLQWTWTDNWKEISKGTADLIYHFHGK